MCPRHMCEHFPGVYTQEWRCWVCTSPILIAIAKIVTLSDRTIPLSKKVGGFSFFYILSGRLNFFLLVCWCRHFSFGASPTLNTSLSHLLTHFVTKRNWTSGSKPTTSRRVNVCSLDWLSVCVAVAYYSWVWDRTFQLWREHESSFYDQWIRQSKAKCLWIRVQVACDYEK